MGSFPDAEACFQNNLQSLLRERKLRVYFLKYPDLSPIMVKRQQWCDTTLTMILIPVCYINANPPFHRLHKKS